MAHEVLAPWGELVANAPYPMTIDDLLALPDDGWMYELIDGRLVRMPHSGGEASSMGLNLAVAVANFVMPRRLGRLTGADGTYVFSKPADPTTALVPDLAFVRAERLPPRDSPQYARPWVLAPDLAAEIVSPDQWRPEMAAKARAYLRYGVRLVWIVWPRYTQIDVWTLGHDQPVTLRLGDTLDGGDVLPGFTLPVVSLFE